MAMMVRYLAGWPRATSTKLSPSFCGNGVAKFVKQEVHPRSVDEMIPIVEERLATYGDDFPISHLPRGLVLFSCC
jgi:hypothetical protein